MALSKRALSINPSQTLAITARAKAMKKQGIDVISLAAGEPDFDTPDFIKKTAIKAIETGFTKYTPTAGILELRQAIVNKFKRDNGLIYEAKKNILVSNGAKQCLFNVIQVIIDQDDEALLPLPSWVSYDEMVKMAGGKCVYIKTPNFKVSSKILKKYLSKKTKLLILGSPSNPTGTVYEKEELQDIADFCVKNNIYVISDEVYEKLIYGKTHYSIAGFNEKIKKLTITVNGFSKTYAMTGWRIGYCAGEEEIIKVATNLQDHSTSGANSITQKAALAALTGPQEFLKNWVKQYRQRRDYMFGRLNKIKGLKPHKPDGAFYMFVDFSHYKSNPSAKNSIVFCQNLLEKAHIATIPGGAFGDDNYIRLSFATSMENITKALDRLEKYLNFN